MAADPKQYFNSTVTKIFINIPGYTSFCGQSAQSISESGGKKRK